MHDKDTHYTAYTDGSCAPSNPGPGGHAYLLYAPDGSCTEGQGHSAETSTNNREELKAAILVLKQAPTHTPLTIRSDSQYLCNGMNEWMSGWIKKDWKNAKKKPVENKDLWLELKEIAEERGSVIFEWVRGHNGNADNERVDELAGEASNRAYQMYLQALRRGPQEGEPIASF